MNLTTIWTIGHSTRPYDVFKDLLTKNNIEVIADVRSLPGSNKFPWFNQENLAAVLPADGIAYLHFPGLGGRRKSHKDSRNTAWRHPAFRSYADYMETPDFHEAIRKLITRAQKKRTCLLCAEAVWWRCHRSMISDYLKADGWTVLHIMDQGKVMEHPYTSAATVHHGVLSYGGSAIKKVRKGGATH